MDKKYIVKNCPCIYSKHYKCDGIYYGLCQDCTNCLIKQVIEKCREVQCPCPDVGACCYECPIGAERDFANKIMQLFEIEEVNNNK